MLVGERNDVALANFNVAHEQNQVLADFRGELPEEHDLGYRVEQGVAFKQRPVLGLGPNEIDVKGRTE